MGWIIKLLINTLSLMAVAYLLKGFHIKDFSSALKLAIVLAVINTIIRPLALLISLPINIITLGLFTFVVNAAMLKLAGAIVSDVEVEGWGAAIIAAVLLAVVSTALSWIVT